MSGSLNPIPCPKCGGEVEGSVALWLNFDQDMTVYVDGLSDEINVSCADCGADCVLPREHQLKLYRFVQALEFIMGDI